MNFRCYHAKSTQRDCSWAPSFPSFLRAILAFWLITSGSVIGPDAAARVLVGPAEVTVTVEADGFDVELFPHPTTRKHARPNAVSVVNNARNFMHRHCRGTSSSYALPLRKLPTMTWCLQRSAGPHGVMNDPEELGSRWRIGSVSPLRAHR